jgi:hypothetical protein
MKKVLLLAVVLLISGLSFAQTPIKPSPIKPFVDNKEDGHSVNQAVNFFSKNKNSVQAESLRETFLNIPAIKKYFPNLSVDDAIYLLSCSIKRMGHFEKGEYIINGIQDGKVVVCPDRGSLADRLKGIPGDEPWILFDVTEVLKDSFKITIPSVPPVPVVLARCLNTLTLNVVDVLKKPTPEMPVVERVQNQQMSSDTNIINVNIEIPANFGSNNNVVQGDGVSTVGYNNQGYYNNGCVNNSNYFDPNYYSTPVRNLNAFMTANQNVGQRCGTYDGNPWGNNYGYDVNQNYYNYNNTSFSNTASWGNASAGAYFGITGTATTVPVWSYTDPNVYYNGHLRQANNNNGGRVMQPRRGVNQMQNNQQQNQRIAENRNAKPYDGSMW